MFELMVSMLETVHAYLGYTVYNLRKVHDDLYILDRYNRDNALINVAERMGDEKTIYHYISGMAQVVHILIQKDQ